MGWGEPSGRAAAARRDASPHPEAATERGPPEAAKMAAPHAVGVVAVMEAGRHLQVTLFS